MFSGGLHRQCLVHHLVYHDGWLYLVSIALIDCHSNLYWNFISIRSTELGNGLFILQWNTTSWEFTTGFAMQGIPITTLWTLSAIFFCSSLMFQCRGSTFLFTALLRITTKFHHAANSFLSSEWILRLSSSNSHWHVNAVYSAFEFGLCLVYSATGVPVYKLSQ